MKLKKLDILIIGFSGLLILALVTASALVLYIDFPTNNTNVNFALLIGASVTSVYLLVYVNYKTIGLRKRAKELQGEYIKNEETISELQKKQIILLEYQLAIVNGMAKWLLENGKFEKKILADETQQILKEALDQVQKDHPGVDINFDEPKQDTGGKPQ